MFVSMGLHNFCSKENRISDLTLSFPEALLINIFHHWMEADYFNMVIYRFWLAVLWLWRSKSTECDETTGLEEKEALMGLLAPWTVALLSSFCAPVFKIGLTGESLMRPTLLSKGSAYVPLHC